MTKRLNELSTAERLNFLLTNRIPRRTLTQFMGWYSKINSPLLTRLSIKIWRLFASDLDLSEAKEKHFNSLHDCFIRELKEGLRPIDDRKEIVSSPSDGIVGACGMIKNGMVYQAKGFPYDLDELLQDSELAAKFQNGTYLTIRLKSSMYHRFHAPVACEVNQVNYISGDTWNVNPIALKQIEKLYCKNERAILQLNTEQADHHIVLVPVAAILVASMKFHCLTETLDLKYKGPNQIACSAHYEKGDEMGYFQHGSTIIIFTSSQYQLCDGIVTGKAIKMGQALLTERYNITEI